MPKAKEVELTLDNALHKEQAEKIRKLFRSGKREITISDRKFTISKSSRRVSYLVGGEPVARTEDWLTLRPTDGSLVPVVQIEFKDQGNMRTATAK